jgi:hypothetical protein
LAGNPFGLYLPRIETQRLANKGFPLLQRSSCRRKRTSAHWNIPTADCETAIHSDDGHWSVVIADSAEVPAGGWAEFVVAVGDIASGCGPE